MDDCWNFRREGPNSNDLALLFLNKEINNQVVGRDYVDIWNPADHDDEDITGSEFIIAGYGMSGPIKNGNDRHLNDDLTFHRGFNEINEISKNIIHFTMDEDGLDMESMGYDGDSGSGSFIQRDGELYLIGVNSFGQRPKWGSKQGDVWVGGPAREWILANLESEEPVSSKDYQCDDWSKNTMSFDEDFDNEEDDEMFFNCNCDCDEDDDECEAECDSCLAASNAHMHSW